MDRLLRLLNKNIPEKLKLRLVKLYKILPFSLAQVTFHPTFRCNYHCAYCLYPRYINKDNPVFNSFIPHDEWIRLFDKFPKSTVTISGGEPLLYKDLDKLLLGICRRHIISQVVSNISTNLDVLVRARKAGFRIMASFHKDMVSLEEFSKNLLYLKKHGFNIIVNFVGTKENISRYSYYKDHFEKKLKVFFKIDACEDLERDEEAGNLKIHGINYIIDRKQFNNNRIKKCLAGSKFFVLMPDAAVYRCFSGFMYSNSDKFRKLAAEQDKGRFVLGNLKDPQFTAGGNERFICQSPCRGVCDIELADVRL